MLNFWKGSKSWSHPAKLLLVSVDLWDQTYLMFAYDGKVQTF